MNFRLGPACLALVLLAGCAANVPAAGTKPVSVKITNLSTMLTDRHGIGEWGYAALVEVDGRRLLFDTGARPQTVLDNARELELSLGDITDVVLSHNHTDHTGGLLTLRRSLMEENPDAMSRAYVGKGIFLPRGEPLNFSADMQRLRTEYEALGGTFIVVDAPLEIMPQVWLTGPVPRIHEEKNWNPSGRILESNGSRPDDIPEDQSLVIDTQAGLIIVSGCGHAGIVNTADFARAAIREAEVTAIIGGLHLLAASDEQLAWTGTRLKALGVDDFIGAHCTGIQAVYTLRDYLELERRHAVVGAVGAVYELGRGIEPGRLAH